MSEIPEDVMEAANEQADKFFPLTGSPVSIIANEALSETIARAILAERERAARIAEETAQGPYEWQEPGDYDWCASMAANGRAHQIATAIRGKP